MKILLVLAPIILLLLLGQLRTAHTNSQELQKEFLKGTLPSPLPNGFYKGNVNVGTSWEGKVFDARNNTGINRFSENDKTHERYPFKTYQGRGLVDKNLSVLKLDYNLPGNPLYLRFVVDELVQTDQGKYIGKLNMKIGPFAFALGFFTLKK